MITIGINGACGRMGLSSVRLIAESNDLKTTLALECPGHPNIGKDIGIIAGLAHRLNVAVSAQMDKRVDVLIDFSAPNALMPMVKHCLEHKCALLIGTTGLGQKEISRIKAAAKKIPCLTSPNMSPGAAVLFKIAPQIASLLGTGYDIEIVETHHRFKKDMPSGTASRLADFINTKTHKKTPIHSLRIGDTVGEHSVFFGTLGERIELIHRVQNRDIFAVGALKAARFLANAKAGLYTMSDVFAEK
jgi:4-hydroxy-tetrahydrodipicolinate reductase